ncbi:uncharacterized protein [Nicotiana tomentosiformis]|uniref:uncharacterized protein n=1 Tax=Nicotiana tomentosiformis TaxID=4098 RepID=UPI00388CB1E9
MVVAPVVAPSAPPARGGGHTGRGCPRGRGHARFYVFSGKTEAIASDAVITGIVPDISRDSLSAPVYVSMLVGDSIIVDRVYRSCLVIIGGYDTRVDLLLLCMVYFDVIFGMNWLSPYHTILDCHAKAVTFVMPGLPQLEWRGTLDYIPSRVGSFLKAQQMVEKGCE